MLKACGDSYSLLCILLLCIGNYAYGYRVTETKKIRLVIIAVRFSVFSTDFLLQYSPDHDIQATQAPSHPFGLIKSTDQTKRIPLRIIIISKNVFIIV